MNDDDDETINDVDNHDDNYDYDDFKETWSLPDKLTNDCVV